MTDPVEPDAERPRDNLAALAVTRLVIAVSGLIANVALIELLPRDTFGAYRLIWAVVAIATVGATLGLGTLVNREVARTPARAAELVGLGLGVTRWLSAGTGVAICAWFALTRPGDGVMLAAAALGAATLAANAADQVVLGGLHGLRRMSLEVPAVLASRLVFVVSQVGLAAAGAGLVALYAGRFAAALVLLLLLHRQFHHHVGAPVRAHAPGAALGLLRQTRLFAATVAFSAISAQGDIVLLGLFSDDVEVARYGAPAAVLLQLAFIANIFSRGFFPRLVRLVGNPGAAGEELGLLLRLQLLLSAPIAVGGVVLAVPLLGLFRDGAYADAWLPFVLVLAAVPLRFVSNALGSALTALDRQRVRARVDAIGASFNVAANLVAIPWFGAEGAAATTLATDLLLLSLAAWQVREVARVPGLVVALGRVGLAAAGMGAGVAWAGDLHVLVRVGLGAALFGGLAWGVGAIRPAELRRLRRV